MGRARRVVIVAGDDVTSGSSAPWIGTGLLASGATTTEGELRMAALPFDRRRNGMIMGMGAAALVVESEDAVRERGMRGICEVLATQIANSAFHGTRLDVAHVSDVMDRLVSQAEERFGIDRRDFGDRTMFMSHETYTPARGGSASAEINALRHTFGDQANKIIVANTKGYTGHTMGVGIEDVVAVKALENGVVPPIANYDDNFEPDPELGDLNLSRGGAVPLRYALRLGAGFGSQIAMSLLRTIPGGKERINRPVYNQWLADVAGYDQADLEVEKRTLRVHHAGPPAKTPAQSQWKFGQGPTLWADRPEDSAPLGAAVARPEEHITQPQPVVEVQDQMEPLALASAPMPAGIDRQEVKSFVLDQVSQKTGYPIEMLDLDLDLEADLGVDTVKQAELFAAIREHYDIPRREDLRLVDYNTLNKVVQFMIDSAGQTLPAAQPVDAGQANPQPQPAVSAAAVKTAPVATGAVLAGTPAAGREEVQAFVLAQVSEKTGYPIEMLDPDLDLEADLGIDTVKQAELFAAIREKYDIPRREDLRLVEYNTLNKVVQYMLDMQNQPEAPIEVQPLLAVESKPVAEPVEAAVPAVESQQTVGSIPREEIQAYVLAQISEKTGYPVEMLDPDLDLEADLGIDTVKQAELFAAVRTNYDIPRREDLRLVDYNTLAKVTDFVVDSLEEKAALKTLEAAEQVVVNLPEISAVQPQAAAEAAQTEAESQTVQIRRRVPVPVLRPRLDLCVPTGVELNEGDRVLIYARRSKVADSLARRLRGRKAQAILLHPETLAAGLDKVRTLQAEGPIKGIYYLAGLDEETPIDDSTAEAWTGAFEERVLPLYHLLREVQGDPFLVCGTRLGGLLGYGPQRIQSPLGGAISGFTKALKLERLESLIKVVDFEAETPDGQIAGRLLDETLRDPAIYEVGYEGDKRFTVVLVDREAAEGSFELGEKPVFLVSGGSGGITVPIVEDLARKTGGIFYLLGRSQIQEKVDPDLQRVLADRESVKRSLIERAATAGQKLTPSQIDRELLALERAASALDAVRRVEAAGGQATYLSCDVSDAQSAERAVAQIVAKHGRVDVLLHAAGIDRSRKLESKPEDEFRMVTAIKMAGLIHLYKAIQSQGSLPKAVVMFGSVAGRFGNTGQTDYAAANSFLAMMGFALQQAHPQMKTVVIDWSAWAGVGMASRGYIPRLMARAGVDLIAAEEAAPLVYQELTNGEMSAEVVLAGSLGVLEGDLRADGGLDLAAANKALVDGEPIHVMLSRAAGLTLHDGILLEAELDPNSEPFLKDHAMNGIPLLPGVMGIEGFSVAARHVSSVLGSPEAGFSVTGLQDVQFLAPFKFYRGEKRRITWKAQVVREKDGLVGYVTLESTLAMKVRKNEVVRHFSGKVQLTPVAQTPREKTVTPPAWNGAYTVGREDIYKLYFHGPAFQVLEGVQRSGDIVLGKLRKNLPPMTGHEQTMLTTPVLVELCLQTAGVWEIGETGSLALPRSIGDLDLYPLQPNGVPIYAEVTPLHFSDEEIRFDARVVDAKGHLYLELRDYRTSRLPYSVEPELLAPLRQLVTEKK